MVFGGRWAPVENTAAGWRAISRSTGLPQRRKRGNSRSFMRARVNATIGSSKSQSPAFSGKSPSAATAPYRRRYCSLTCQPAASRRPNGWLSRKLSRAHSSSHCANIAKRRSCRRAAETMGAPNRMRTRHSACWRPATVMWLGGRISVPVLTLAGNSTKWKECITLSDEPCVRRNG